MTKFLRLSLMSCLLGAPLWLAAPAGATEAVAPAGYEEVAAAPDGAQARSARRHRTRHVTAHRQRSQVAHRARRTRAAQG